MFQKDLWDKNANANNYFGLFATHYFTNFMSHSTIM